MAKVDDARGMVLDVGNDLACAWASMPGGVVAIEDAAWLALSGHAGVADLNMAGVATGAPTGTVTRFVDEIAGQGLDAILLIDPGATDALDEAGGDARLVAAGTAPLMLWEDGDLGDSVGYDVRPATPGELPAAAALCAAAFSLPLGPVAEMYTAEIDPRCTFWVVIDGDELVGTSLFVDRGEQVGIYNMSTPEAHRSRGVGRAALTVPMHHHLDRGARWFDLAATADGFPLYEKVGFTTRAEAAVFVVGASTQFSA